MKAGSSRRTSDGQRTVTLPATHRKRDKLAQDRTPDVADVFDDESGDVLDAAQSATDAGDTDILEDADKAAILAAILAALQDNQSSWSDALLSLYQDAAGQAAQGILDALPSDFPLPDGFSATSADAQQLDDWAAAAAESIVGTTGDRLGSLIDGAGDDATLADLTQAVSDTYDTWQGAQDDGDPDACRASVIAGDTVTAGWGFGEQDVTVTLTDSVDSLSVEREWNTLEDDRVRESHAEAQGQIVGPDEPFQVGDDELMYPGDPEGSDEETANCRCFVYTTYTWPGGSSESESDEGDDSGGDTESMSRRISRLARKHRRDTFRAFRAVTVG